MLIPADRASACLQHRNGLKLYAALEVATVVGSVPDRTDFLRFIKRLARRYRKQEQAWEHPRVHFHFTGASWLNMVEAWFSILRKSVRRGSFDSVRSLTQHIRTLRVDSATGRYYWTEGDGTLGGSHGMKAS